MLSRLFTPWHGAATGAQPAHVDPTLDSCTRYPSLLGGQRQCRMRSLLKAPTHDQRRESNPRPLDLWSSALPTGPRDPIQRLTLTLVLTTKILNWRVRPTRCTCQNKRVRIFDESWRVSDISTLINAEIDGVLSCFFVVAFFRSITVGWPFYLKNTTSRPGIFNFVLYYWCFWRGLPCYESHHWPHLASACSQCWERAWI